MPGRLWLDQMLSFANESESLSQSADREGMLMNERVKAIFLAALKLTHDERMLLAQSLAETLGADPADVDQLCLDIDTGNPEQEQPPQPTSDVLAKYLDI
ncbi:MAG: hypothetical protein AB7S70_09135 [Hyphomicrobium sp.]|uniref:hypothetical protein n=1 Tax=Hyphomicrobium sp. TaxID=82 RepID=UPI003D0F8848